jgi:predicted nucleic acid-binding protein
MVLVDTSVWIRFLANRKPFAEDLDRLVDQGLVARHDLVYGELWWETRAVLP